MIKQNIIDQLSKIKYPGFSKDIISFGMLNEILISEKSITINLSQSTNDQNILNQIKSDILEKVASINHSNREIEIIMSPSENLNKNNIDVQRNKNIKNIIAISSGKGGVGKSTIAINIASELSKSHKVGLLDLDIYGPSLPTLIGDKQVPKVVENNLLLPIDKFNMKFMSFGFLNSKNDPAIWRGPMVSKLTHQFFDNVDWGELDYLILDLPPGTGDIQLTLVQKIALSGAVIVTTPQELAHKDVQKGSDMFNKVNAPVLGIIENMSFLNITGKLSGHLDGIGISIDGISEKINLDDNGVFSSKIKIFQGKSASRESERLNIPLLGHIPLDPTLSLLSDLGKPCVFEETPNQTQEAFSQITKKIIKILPKQIDL